MKPHYYKIKEKLMASSGYKQDLNIFGTPTQPFTDLAPSTSHPKTNFTAAAELPDKVLLVFPLPALLHIQDGEGLLLELGIISRDRLSPSSSTHQNRPLSPIWSSQLPKQNGKTPPHT